MRWSLLSIISLVFLGLTLVELGFLYPRLFPPRVSATMSIPGDVLLPPASTATPTPPLGLVPGSTIQHRVVEGEWLTQIARCYGASVDGIREANPQIPNPAPPLQPNMIIAVPQIGSLGKVYGPPCVAFYTVKSGDTWVSIAQRYNTDIAVLQVTNKGVLAIGTVLRIPINSAGGWAGGGGIRCANPVSLNIPSGSAPVIQSGTVETGGSLCFILGESQAPEISVKVRSPDGPVKMGIVNLDEEVIKPADDNELSWSGPVFQAVGSSVILLGDVANAAIHYTLEITAVQSTLPTPSPTPPPTKTALTPTQSPAPAMMVKAQWPEKLIVGDSDTIRITLFLNNKDTDALTRNIEGNISSTSTVKPIATFGADYEALVAPMLVAVNITHVSYGIDPQPLKPIDGSSSIDWVWSITADRPGSQTVNAFITVEWQRKDGLGPSVKSTIWDTNDEPIHIEVVQPLVTTGSLSLSTILSSGLSIPFLYEIIKSRRKKTPPKRKSKSSRSSRNG